MKQNVIDLREKLLDRGEADVLFCPDCMEKSLFVPVIRRNTQGDFLSLLVCVGEKCQGDGIFYDVLNGYLSPPERVDFNEGDII